VKAETATEQISLACELAREIARRRRLDVDVLASFDHQALVEATAVVPGLRCAPDRLPERGPSDGRAVVEQARAVGAAIVQHHHADLSAATVEEAHEAGVAIWAWPANARPEIERMLELGVDGVMGDDVAAIVSALSGGA